MSQFDHSTQVQRLLDLIQAGDQAARDKLIEHAFERLRLHARRMFRRHYRLRSVVETDDVLQGAAMRLRRALPDVRPETVGHFFALAAQQIRRELFDLARRHLGHDGQKAARVILVGSPGATSCAQLLEQQGVPGGEPESLLDWTTFHEAVETLPEEERQVVNLLYYQGMDQAEAAAVLHVSVRTVKRRWRVARVQLGRALHGEWPTP